MSTLGIGIVTFNRMGHLRQCLERIHKYTKTPYKLVVADDGSTDGSREFCLKHQITILGSNNKGVCWNKNRALFALQEFGCDQIILLEDDCWPSEPYWDYDWRIATTLFGHVAYAHSKLTPWILAGSGTPVDPFVNNKATAQCSSISANLLRRVGFFDTRFKGYGVGHAEWTSRIKRIGAGYRWAVTPEGQQVRANLYIRGGLEEQDAPTFKDRANVARNEALFEALKKEQPYRKPWSNEQERDEFSAEMASVGIDIRKYEKSLCEIEEGLLLSRYPKPNRKTLIKLLSNKNSFLYNNSWFESIASGISFMNGAIVPWLNYAMIGLLNERAQPHWRIFEFGAGFSTVWWSFRVNEVISVEHDQSWISMISRIVNKNTTRIIFKEPHEFASALEVVGGCFDIIVVDGAERPACAIAALDRLNADGVLIFDNTHRPEYQESIDQIMRRGFKQLKLTAPAPMTVKMETSSVFYRENNCLGL